MTFTIEEAAAGTHLLIKVVGKITVPFAVEFIDAAHRAAEKKGITSLLYDVTEAENVESALENFGLVHDELPRLKVKRSTQIILLTALHDHSHDFIETASRNAGYNVTICRDWKSALQMVEARKPEAV